MRRFSHIYELYEVLVYLIFTDAVFLGKSGLRQPYSSSIDADPDVRKYDGKARFPGFVKVAE